MTTSTANWTLPGAAGETILGTTHWPSGAARGVLIVCHGFKGYKDYGFLPHVADAAARHGLIAHRFNFSHSGMTEQIDTFERPDLFEADTWSKQVTDLHTVAQAIERNAIAGSGLPCVWFGHSRGGVTVLLTAGEVFEGTAPDTPAPAAIVGAATPDYCVNLDEQQKAQLRAEGRVEIYSSRTGQTLAIGKPWLDEIEADPERFDPVRAAEAVKCPMLFIHGDQDPTVPVEAADRLARAGASHARRLIIEGAQHTFNAANPLPLEQTPPTETGQMIEATCRFALEQME
jgi:alpha-beta hydrolase superfamily lysophospholipase